MKGLAIFMAVCGFSLPAFASGGLMNADIVDREQVMDPTGSGVVDGWVGFTVPALEGTRSPCCWHGRWDDMGDAGCSLGGSHASFGSRNDAGFTDRLWLYARLEGGETRALRVVGDHCPVEGDGARVTWLGDIDESAGLDWLEGLQGLGEGVGAAGMYVLARHSSPDATRRLERLARVGGDRAGEAVFWLGEARGEAGFQSLDTLLHELPRGDTRRRINFALSENGSERARALLLDIARQDADAEQRADAAFWLAEGYPALASRILPALLDTEKDTEVRERIVFAVAQLPDGRGDALLFEWAKDSNRDDDLRRQAFFWLAQSDDEKTLDRLADMLTR